jgi:hypothetical protein
VAVFRLILVDTEVEATPVVEGLLELAAGAGTIGDGTPLLSWAKAGAEVNARINAYTAKRLKVIVKFLWYVPRGLAFEQARCPHC